jgi:thymidylate synthase
VTVKDLYLPEKYKVFTGKKENIGFCIFWNDPEQLLKNAPEILENVGIMGTLYSREGINIMLRNLSLNPQITYLILWGKGELSKTSIGKQSREILDKLWEKGIDENNTVVDTSFKLHPNMDKSIIEQVIKNVEVVDMSEHELTQVISKIKKLKVKKPYMKPSRFPEFIRSTDQTLPSEEVGWLVRGKKITDVWIRVVDRVIRYGTTKGTEYGNRQKELAAVTWVIEEEDINNPFIPEWPDELKHLTGLEKNTIEEYISTVFFNSKLPDGTAYTYGQRLMAYPTQSKETVDQIDVIIQKIKKNSSTRRAVASTLYPLKDKDLKSPPCLVFIQALVNNNKIHLFSTVRSHDIFKAAILNAFGLRALQYYIAKKTNFDVGKLSITSNSAHIYEEDWENAKKLCMCEIWERPVELEFNHANESDPRGNIIINVRNNKITLDMVSTEGENLISLEGNTAKEVMKKLSSLDLLSKSYHWGDIGIELQKAEIARDLGIEYKQDRPLTLNQFKK